MTSLAMNGCPLLQLKQFKLTDVLAGSSLKIMSSSHVKIGDYCSCCQDGFVEKVTSKIHFSKAKRKDAKKATLIAMGKIFRKCKAKLNTNYVKKNLFPHFGKIIEAQWAEFIS